MPGDEKPSNSRTTIAAAIVGIALLIVNVGLGGAILAKGLQGEFASGESAQGVDHVLLLQVANDTETSLVDYMMDRVSGFTAIAGVQSVTVGPIVVDPSFMEDRRGPYTYYYRVRLDNLEALKGYAVDPIHTSCVEEAILPIVVGPPLAVDCTNDIVYAE
jgi:hypothetical protein